MNTKADELQEIRRIVTENDSRINQLEQQIQEKQNSLGDEVLAGKNLSKIQEDIRTMARNLMDLKQVREVANRKLRPLEKAILEEERQSVLINQIHPLESKYNEAMIRLIQAMQIVWETDFILQGCYTQAISLTSKYEIETSIGLRTITMGNHDLHNRADLILKKIETKLPEVYKASGAKTAIERAEIKGKIKLPFTLPGIIGGS